MPEVESNSLRCMQKMEVNNALIHEFLTGTASVTRMIISQPTLEDFSVSREPEQKMDLTKVPQCLISTLERVEINKLNMCEGPGIKLATYFLMNSEVLKKLSLNDSRMANEDINFYSGLFIFIKSSRECQVFFDDLPLIMLGRN